jgi:hypothetical protein
LYLLDVDPDTWLDSSLAMAIPNLVDAYFEVLVVQIHRASYSIENRLLVVDIHDLQS